MNNYSELLQSSGSVSMQTQQLRSTAHKVIFKTLSDLNPNFMREIFYRYPKLTHRKDNLYVHTRNTIKFGNTSLGHSGHTYETTITWRQSSLQNRYTNSNISWKSGSFKCNLCRQLNSSCTAMLQFYCNGLRGVIIH